MEKSQTSMPISTTTGMLSPFLGFCPGHVHHGRSIGAERGGQDHFQARVFLLDHDVPDQPKLNDGHSDFRINHLGKFFADILNFIRVCFVDGPLEFVDRSSSSIKSSPLKF